MNSINDRRKKFRLSDAEVKKSAFEKSKHPIDMSEVGIKRMLIFNKFLDVKKGVKYFIGYKASKKG